MVAVLAAESGCDHTRTNGLDIPAAAPPVDIQVQHDAFLVDDDHFDRAYAQLVAPQIPHWLTRPDETNTERGGPGVYFEDPVGHGLDVITRPCL